MEIAEFLLRSSGVVVAFGSLAAWVGVQHSRINTLEREEKARKDRDAKDGDRHTQLEIALAVLDKTVTLEVKGVKEQIAALTGTVHEGMDAVKRSMDGVQRQIANQMKNPVKEFGQGAHDD